MQINFNLYPNFRHGVKEFAERELEGLEKFGFRIERADVFYKHENTPQREHQVEIRLAIPGPDVFARTSDDSFQKAFVKCVDKLATQLNRRKPSKKHH